MMVSRFKMMGYLKWCFLGVLSVLVLSQSVVFGTYADQLDLERTYTQRVQSALDAMYGENVFITKISVNLAPSMWQVVYTEQSNAKVKKDSSEEKKINILPGYPVIKNLAPDSENVPFNSRIISIPAPIRKIDVKLIADNSFSKVKARRAKELVETMLSLDSKRGDSVEIDFQPFYRRTPSGVTGNMNILSEPSQMLTVETLFYSAFLLLFIVFLVLYAKYASRSALPGTGGKGSDSANISVSPNIEVSSGEGGSGGDFNLSTEPGIKRYFSFVTNQNVGAVIEVLKKNTVNVEQIARIMSFLPPTVSKKILLAQDVKEQASIALHLLNQTTVNREEFEALETQIRQSLECLSGGERAFKSVFDLVTSEDKRQLLTLLGKRNPAGYKAFRQNVLLFDDLSLLEDSELQDILSEVNVDLISTSLIGADKELYDKVFRNLTGSAKAIVEQFLQLKGASIPRSEIEKAQERILSILQKLEDQGKIDLKSKIKSA